jgi:hypothetical protein
MLAKMTVKNQLTLPKSIVSQFPGVEYFTVKTEYDRIVLEPVRINQLAQVREKLEALGLSETDVGKAVKWSRGHQ